MTSLQRYQHIVISIEDIFPVAFLFYVAYFVLLKYNSCTINSVYNSICFSILTELCNHHYNQFRIFSSLKKKLCRISSHTPFFVTLPGLGNHQSTLCPLCCFLIYRHFSFLCVYISHSFCVFLLSFYIQKICCINQFFFMYKLH